MLLSVILGASHAEAAIFEYSGSTAGGQTWNRPNEGNPPTQLSTVGTDVSFSAWAFSVDTSGDYSFEVVSAKSFDPFLFLYQGSFNHANPLDSNAVLDGNDDQSFGNSLSKFSHSLNAGTNYYLVTTGYQNFDAGLFTNQISGLGNITPAVPEPEEWAMMLVGAALVSFQVRRKQSLK